MSKTNANDLDADRRRQRYPRNTPFWFDHSFAGPADWWKSSQYRIAVLKKLFPDTRKIIAFCVEVMDGDEMAGEIASIDVTVGRPKAAARYLAKQIAADPDLLDQLKNTPGVEDCRAKGPFVYGRCGW